MSVHVPEGFIAQQERIHEQTQAGHTPDGTVDLLHEKRLCRPALVPGTQNAWRQRNRRCWRLSSLSGCRPIPYGCRAHILFSAAKISAAVSFRHPRSVLSGYKTINKDGAGIYSGFSVCFLRLPAGRDCAGDFFQTRFHIRYTYSVSITRTERPEEP